MKNKSLLWIKLIITPLLFLILCVLGWIISLYVFSIIDSHKIYYLPEIKTYIRLYSPPPISRCVGYIMFSKDKDLLFSEKCDIIKMAYGPRFPYTVAMNRLDDHIYIYCRGGVYVIEINSDAFTVETEDFVDLHYYSNSVPDTTFYKQEITPQGDYIYTVKPPYSIFVILGNFSYIGLPCTRGGWTRLEPLNSKYKLSKQQETDLMSINSALRVIDFNGGIDIVHREIRNTSAEVIELTLPDSVYELSVKYEISSIVVEPEFIYFVRGGFKGMTYGLVFSSVPKDRLNGFYEFELVRQRDSTHYWYSVSSRFY